MDALSLIVKNLDVELMLNHFAFDKMREDGNYIRCACAIHGGKDATSFVISKETGLYFCHTQCGGGDAFKLVQQIQGVSFPAAVQWLASFTGVSIDGMEIRERKPSHIKQLETFIQMMQKRKKEQPKPYHIDGEVRRVMKYRAFKPETLQKFELGFTPMVTLKNKDDEEYKMYQRLVFPNYNNGTMHMVSFRKTKNAQNPKWSHQPVHINCGNFLYNLDNAKGCDVIVVVEGILDVWAYDEISITAVCTYGAHITDEQYKLLLKTGADIVLSFDGDEAGRSATTKAIKMFKNKTNLYTVSLPDGADPESITREELMQYYVEKRRC